MVKSVWAAGTAGRSPLSEVVPGRVELLDAVIAGVGDLHVSLIIDRDTFGRHELPARHRCLFRICSGERFLFSG